MSIKIEEFLPGVRENGIVTDKEISTAAELSSEGQLSVGDGHTNTDISNYPVQVTGNINDFLGVIVQNLSAGDSNFTDIIASANNDTPGFVGHYADMGITGSGFSGASAALGIIKTLAVSVAGSGYAIGDILTISTGDANAQVEVLTLTGTGVATVSILDAGTNYTTGVKATTGGSGSGCTINITTLVDFSGILANDGYFYTSGGNTIVATDDGVAGRTIKMLTGGLATANERARVDNTGLIVMPVTAVPAGGTAATGLRFSSTANLGIFFGSGVPTLSAAQGSLYLRTDGSSTTTRMYVNTNGSTTWTAVSTVA